MKNHKNMKLFSIVPPRLGGLDLILPLYIKLKEQHPKLKIEIAFMDDKAYQDLFRDDFLYPEVKNCTDRIYRLKPQKGGKIRNRFFSFLNSWPLFVQILTAPNPVLIHSGLEESLFIRLLSKVVRMRSGKIFTHLPSLHITIGVSPPDRLFGKVPDMDAFLYFGKSDTTYLENRQFPKLIQMGYPRLFSFWKEYVSNKSPELVKRELKKKNLSPDLKLVTVFVPSTVESVFNLYELKDWLTSVLHVLRNDFPEDVIFLKPHPLQKMGIVDQVLKETKDKNITISFLHAGILAASSQLVISHHSSTIVDSMGLLVPSIHYQNFTPHWLQRHPDGSFCLKLNPLWARDEDELRKCIATALSKNYHVPKIETILGHKEDVSMFFN
jgi:hypothetical protein